MIPLPKSAERRINCIFRQRRGVSADAELRFTNYFGDDARS
jgi:hypothetical protein